MLLNHPFHNHKDPPLHLNILLGQILSLCIAGSASLFKFIKLDKDSKDVIDISSIQLILVYFVVSFCSILYLRKSKIFFLKKKIIILISLCDVAASLTLSLAYIHIKAISWVAILSTISTPTSILMSYFIFGKKPSHKSISCVSVALLSIFIMYFTTEDFSLLPAFLATFSAVIYAISNVLTELLSKSLEKNISDPLEPIIQFILTNSLLCFCWGSLYSVIFSQDQFRLLYNNINNSYIIIPLLAYIFVLSIFYCLMPFVLIRTSATFFNISLLAINFYSIFFDFVLFNISFKPEFIILFIILISCLFIYNKLEKNDDDGLDVVEGKGEDEEEDDDDIKKDII